MAYTDDLNRDLIVDRLAGRFGDDTTLPPLRRGSERIPPVTNITLTGATKGVLGDTFLISWITPVDLKQISYFILHVFKGENQTSYQTQLVEESPAFLTLASTEPTTFTIKIQPVLRSGLTPSVDSCGTITARTNAVPISISTFGLYLDTTSNSCGQSQLTAGSVTITTDKVKSTSKIFLSRQTAGGVLGHLSVSNIIPNTSFDIISSDPGDLSLVNWLLFN